MTPRAMAERAKLLPPGDATRTCTTFAEVLERLHDGMSFDATDDMLHGADQMREVIQRAWELWQVKP